VSQTFNKLSTTILASKISPLVTVTVTVTVTNGSKSFLLVLLGNSAEAD
jgi:hypothetical protein